MIIYNNIYERFKSAQDDYGLNSDSYNMFPQLFMNSDCKRFDKLDELIAFGEDFFEIDKFKKSFMPKIGHRMMTFNEASSNPKKVFSDGEIAQSTSLRYYDRFRYNNVSSLVPKMKIKYDTISTPGEYPLRICVLSDLYYFNLDCMYSNRYFNYDKDGGDIDVHQIYRRYLGYIYKDFFASNDAVVAHILKYRTVPVTFQDENSKQILRDPIDLREYYGNTNPRFDDEVKINNNLNYPMFWQSSLSLDHNGYYVPGVYIDHNVIPGRSFNHSTNANDTNTISMKPFEIDYPDSKYHIHREDSRFCVPFLSGYTTSTTIDVDTIKPVDMFVGTHELMRKGILPAFFMGIDHTGMDFSLNSWKKVDLIDTETNGLYTRQNKLSFSGFTGKRYALYNRTIKPYLNNNIKIPNNIMKNKDTAAVALYKVCNGSSYQEWLPLTDCKAIIEANWQGNSVDLLDNNIHKEIDKRLFADIDRKFPKFLNYYKNMDIAVQSFMVEDLNNLAILMPYGKHTFISIDNDENIDVEYIQFSINIDASINEMEDHKFYYIENVGWISWYAVSKIPNEDGTAYSYIIKFKVTYDPGNILDENTIDSMDNVTTAGFDARCFMVQSEYSYLFTDQTSFKQVPVISPLLFLGGAQVTEIIGPVFQFNVDKMGLAVKLNHMIQTYDKSFEDNDITNMCKYMSLFNGAGVSRDIGALVHVMFTLYGPHGKWDFILDRMGAVVKADKIFDPVLTNLKNNFTLNDETYKKFFEYYMTANQQYSPRKNPYAYLTKVDCYAANIANNFDSLTDEFTFIGPMVDDKEVYDNYPLTKGWEPLMPHINNGAVGFQAEMRAFIFNHDLTYKLDDMKHNVTNRWYVAPHSYTRKQYDMTNAYCVGSDFDVIIKPKYSFFANEDDNDNFIDVYKDKYTRFKYHIMSPEYAYTQNVLTFGYKINGKLSNITGLYFARLFNECEKVIVNYNNLEDIFNKSNIIIDTDLNIINKNNNPNAFIWNSIERGKTQNTRIGEMLYISLVFDQNKEYIFQGFDSVTSLMTNLNRLKRFAFFNSSTDSSDYNRMDLVSITGHFPRMSNKNVMYVTYATYNKAVAYIKSNEMLNKFFETADFSKVEVIGDRLFENWNGDIPAYFLSKLINLKVIPQALYHSMFTDKIVLPPKVEVIPDYIWDNKHMLFYSIEPITNREVIRYIVEPAGNTNAIFKYEGNITDFAFTTWLNTNTRKWPISPNIGTKGNFLMPWNEQEDRSDNYYHDNEIRRVFTNMKNAFIGKQFVIYDPPVNNADIAVRGANKKYTVTILCNKYYKPMSGAAYNYHRMNLSENISGMKIGKMKFNDVVKYVSWVPNYFVGWQTDEALERDLDHWNNNFWPTIENRNNRPWKDVMNDYNRKLLDNSGIFGSSQMPESAKKLFGVKYHPEWFRNLIIFKPLRYGLDSIIPDLLSKGAETPKNVFLSMEDIQNNIKIPHEANNTRWNELIAYHPSWAFFHLLIGNNFPKLDYKEGFYEETLGNVLWINSGLTTDIYKHKYQYIPFKSNYYGRSYKWNSGDKFNHFDVKSVLMSYIDKIVIPQRSQSNVPGNEINNMLWTENDGIHLWIRNGSLQLNYDPYYNSLNVSYYNYRDKTRKAMKQFNYNRNYKNSRIYYIKYDNNSSSDLALEGYVKTRYPINAYPELIEDWSEQIAEHGDQWLGYKPDALIFANNLLMVYDYQKFMDSPFFERTDIGLENYGAYNRDYTTSAEFATFPTPWNLSRRDGSGLITGMLVPPVFNVLGSNDNKNNEVKTLWSRKELPAFVDDQNPANVNTFKRNFNMVKNLVYSNSRLFNYNDITVYKRGTNYDNVYELIHTRKLIKDKGNNLFTTIPPFPEIIQRGSDTTFSYTTGENEWQNLFLYCAFPSCISLDNSINYSNKTYFDIYRRGAQYMTDDIYTTMVDIATPEIKAVASGPYEKSEVKINVPTKYTVFMDYNNALSNSKVGNSKYYKNADILDDIRWVDMYNGINRNSDIPPKESDSYNLDPKYYIKVLLGQKNRPNVNNLNVMPDQFALNYKMASTPTVPALTSNYAINWRDAYYIHPCKIYEVSMSRTLGFRNVFEYHLAKNKLDNNQTVQLQYNSIALCNRFKQNYKFICDNDNSNLGDIYDNNMNRVIMINRQGEMGNHLIATNYNRLIYDGNKDCYAGATKNTDEDFVTLDYRNNIYGLGVSRNIINLSSINQYPEDIKLALLHSKNEFTSSFVIKKEPIESDQGYYYNNSNQSLNYPSFMNNYFNIVFGQVYSKEDWIFSKGIPRDIRFNIRSEPLSLSKTTESTNGFSTYYNSVYNGHIVALQYTLHFANTAQKFGLTNGVWNNTSMFSNINTRLERENAQYRGALKYLVMSFIETPPNITRWINTNGYFEGPLVYSVGSGEFMKVHQDTYNIATMRLHINFDDMWNPTNIKYNFNILADPILVGTNIEYEQRISYRELLSRAAHGWGGLAHNSAKMRYRDAVYGLWMYHDTTHCSNFVYGHAESTMTNIANDIYHDVVNDAVTDTKKTSSYKLIEDVRAFAGSRLNNKYIRHTRHTIENSRSLICNGKTPYQLYNLNNMFRGMWTIFEQYILDFKEVTTPNKVISANNIFNIGNSNGGKSYYNIPYINGVFANAMNLSHPVARMEDKLINDKILMPDTNNNLIYIKDDTFLPQYTSNIENLYDRITKKVINNDKPYEGTIVDKLFPLNHYSYARDIYGYLNKIKLDAPQVPDSVIEGSPEHMYSRNTFSKLTGLTFDLPAGRSVMDNALGVVNIYEFEKSPNGRKLNECKFEFYPLIDGPEHLIIEEGLSIYVNDVEIMGGWDNINVIMENNTFIIEEDVDKVEITIKSAKYNWIVRVIPETNQNDKREPTVKINLPFVSINDGTFTYQALTRMNPYIDKYDIGGFVECYKPGGNNIANIVPFILTFGRIKDIPTNIFEEVRSKKNSNNGISFISTLAGSHIKEKWNLSILSPLRKVAELTDNEFHKIAALMFRMLDTTEEDPIITQENSWINDGISGNDAISGDIYDLIYGNELENPYQVIESMPSDIKDMYLDKFYNGEDAWFDWCKNKISSNQKDHIIPILFANCGNENGFSVSTSVFQNYYIWCKNRSLSDKKLMFIGMFAGSFIKSVPQYLNGIDINTKLQYDDISEMPIWSASEPSKGHILFDNTINFIGKHKDIVNPNIIQRPHLVFMGYLPNDFTYAFCPLLKINNDAIDVSYIGTEALEPVDKINNHIINHRGQYINCTISGTLDIHKMLEIYKNGHDLHIMQLTFGQFDTKQAFFNMIVRIDSSLNSKQIQTFSAKIIDLVKYINVRFIPENSFRFKWFNSNNDNKYNIYADYFLFGRKALINIVNNGTEYMNHNNSYRRGFTNCVNLEKIPENLIPMEYIGKKFPNFLAFVEMFNGCKTYVPTKIFRNPNNIDSGFVTSLNVTNMFKDDYFIIEIDKDANIIEDMNGIDIKIFGKMQETSATITEEKIRNWKHITANYNIVFKEFIAHPESENNRWIPYFFCRVVMYCKIPK